MRCITLDLIPSHTQFNARKDSRGKSGRLIGDLTGLLTTLKGLPLAYNRDLQDTKPGVARISELIQTALEVMALSFEHLEVNKSSLDEAVSDPGLFATDLLEMLVKKGVPFRQAHSMVSELAKGSDAENTPLNKYSLKQFQAICDKFDEDVYKCFVAKDSVAAKSSSGSTGTALVAAALSDLES